MGFLLFKLMINNKSTMVRQKKNYYPEIKKALQMQSFYIS